MNSFSYETSNIDINDLVGLLDRFVDESIYEAKADVVRIKNSINASYLFFVVAYDNDIPVGVLVGGFYDHPLFNVKMASDLVVYIIPEYRGGIISKRLVSMFEEWSKKNNADYIVLGQTTNVGNIERVSKFYEKLGYKTTGFNTLKGL